MTRKNGRNADGTFGSGNRGRPKGSRNRNTLAVEHLLQGEAERLGRKAVELALNGDITALKICLDRIAPPARHRRVRFEMHEMSSANDASQAASSVIRAVADGEIAPAEGLHVLAMLDTYRRVLETTEIEARLKELERRL